MQWYASGKNSCYPYNQVQVGSTADDVLVSFHGVYFSPISFQREAVVVDWVTVHQQRVDVSTEHGFPSLEFVAISLPTPTEILNKFEDF